MATQIARLTPPGKAAIATIAVRGVLAWPITRQVFQPAKGALAAEPVAGKYWYGKLGTEHRDDVVLAVKNRSHVEVHCHGGVEVVRMIEELYVERGAVHVTWQQFQDEPLLALLAQAPTTRTATILLDQVNGAWRRMLVSVNPSIPRLAALISLGQHLVEPWRIVIAGAANVGKSSLMNALAGYTRSVVSSIPGTTRDVVTTQIAIDGWPIELTDTAGIRDTAADLEQRGIERARIAVGQADLRFWLLDGSAEPQFPDGTENWHFVVNKIDLPAAWDWQRAPNALRVSALTQEGLAELCEGISRLLVPAPPAPGEAVPCLPDHVEWVREQATRGRYTENER